MKNSRGFIARLNRSDRGNKDQKSCRCRVRDPNLSVPSVCSCESSAALINDIVTPQNHWHNPGYRAGSGAGSVRGGGGESLSDRGDATCGCRGAARVRRHSAGDLTGRKNHRHVFSRLHRADAGWGRYADAAHARNGVGHRADVVARRKADRLYQQSRLRVRPTPDHRGGRRCTGRAAENGSRPGKVAIPSFRPTPAGQVRRGRLSRQPSVV